MVRGNVAWAAIALGMLAGTARAQTLYSESFEPPVTVGSGFLALGGFGQANNIQNSNWQIQGGGGASGPNLIYGVDNNGVGGSQALFADWDHTGAAAGFYTFNQYTVYGIPGPGAGTPLSAIEVSLDLFINGSETSNTPINVIYQTAAGNGSYTPNLANGAYTHVVFDLAQTTGGVPDLSQAFNLRLEHSAGGFGFDAGNIVRVDNVVVRIIPEPAALSLVPAMMLLARRRKV